MASLHMDKKVVQDIRPEDKAGLLLMPEEI